MITINKEKKNKSKSAVKELARVTLNRGAITGLVISKSRHLDNRT